MIIFLDIFRGEGKFRQDPDKYELRTILDTQKEKFTVVGRNDEKIGFVKKAVALKGRTYLLKDTPWRGGVAGNLRAKPLTELGIHLNGKGGWYKHRVWANGNKIATKDFRSRWEEQTLFVPPPYPFKLQKLWKYRNMCETPVYVVE